MQEIIYCLLEQSLSEDEDISSGALTNIGLVLERHTMDRYDHPQYSELFSQHQELLDLKLTTQEGNRMISFLYWRILNLDKQRVRTAWCIGKYYGTDVESGLLNLLKLFHDEDDICLQLLYSMNALFDSKKLLQLLQTVAPISMENRNPRIQEFFQDLNRVAQEG